MLSALSVQSSRYTGWEGPKRPAVRRSHCDGILSREDHRPLSLSLPLSFPSSWDANPGRECDESDLSNRFLSRTAVSLITGASARFPADPE